jgi:hypothetical protein
MIDLLSIAELPGASVNYLNSQDPFASATHLDGQLSGMDFENRKIVARFLGYDLKSREILLFFLNKSRCL